MCLSKSHPVPCSYVQTYVKVDMFVAIYFTRARRYIRYSYIWIVLLVLFTLALYKIKN